jgi:hypothetical protein
MDEGRDWGGVRWEKRGQTFDFRLRQALHAAVVAWRFRRGGAVPSAAAPKVELGFGLAVLRSPVVAVPVSEGDGADDAAGEAAGNRRRNAPFARSLGSDDFAPGMIDDGPRGWWCVCRLRGGQQW